MFNRDGHILYERLPSIVLIRKLERMIGAFYVCFFKSYLAPFIWEGSTILSKMFR